MANTTLERKGATDIEITVELAPEDYRAKSDAQLKKLAKDVKLKGFRPGKVPMSYLRKLYGKGAIAEAIGKTVDEEINALIKEEELDIFGQLQSVEEPDMEDMDGNFNEPLKFVYSGGLMPQVESVDKSGISDITRYTVKLTDEEAEQRVTDASKRFIDYIERDTIETDEDFATLVVADAELDAKHYGAAGDAHSAEPTTGNDAKDDADADSAEHDGDNSEDAGEKAKAEERDPRQRYFLRPADLKEEQRYKLVDKARGTEIILSLDDLNDDIKERFDKAIPEDGTTSFTITKVDREQLPELNEDTFKQIFGEDTEITDLDAAKAEFSRRFAENSQRNLDDFALEQLIDKLAETNQLEVPNEAIKQRFELARKEELEKAAKEDRAPEYDHDLTQADHHGLARRLKWLAFRQALLREYDVELEKEDIDEGVERAYVQQISGMGIDPEQYRAQFFDMFKQNLLKDRERVMEMTDGLLNVRLMKRLEEEGVIGATREVSEAEFQGIIDEYNTRVGAELDKMREQPLD